MEHFGQVLQLLENPSCFMRTGRLQEVIAQIRGPSDATVGSENKPWESSGLCRSWGQTVIIPCVQSHPFLSFCSTNGSQGSKLFRSAAAFAKGFLENIC